MSKITIKPSKTIATVILMVIFLKIAFPLFADNADKTKTQTAGSIMSFDISEDVIKISQSIEKHLPDFFIIHGASDKKIEFSFTVKENYREIPRHDLDKDSVQNLIFFKNSYDVVRSKNIWLSGTPDKKSKVNSAKKYQTCTYALFSDKTSGKNIAVFASGTDNAEKTAKAQSLYLFSKFQCYRDYYPTLISIKCKDINNTKIFEDTNLSSLLHSQSGLNIYASASVKKQSVDDSMINFETTSSPKRIDPSGKFIALTFDDGPTRLNGRTDKILQNIEKYNVKATFFVLGSRISEDNPVERKLLLRARSLGCEIGNHTYSHDSYAKLGNTDCIQRQINETDLLIEEICGGSYATLLRPPGGIVNDKPDLDRPIINWSIDTLDWASKQTIKGIINTVKRDAGNGKIILMHDIHTKSASAIEDVIKYLQDNGYNLVTVSELMEFCDVDMWAGYIYTDANHEKRTTFCN